MLITCWGVRLHMRLHVRREGHVLGARHLMRSHHIRLPRRMLWDCHVLQPGRMRRIAGQEAACWLLHCCKAAAREERWGRSLGGLRLMRHHWQRCIGGLRCRPLTCGEGLLRLQYGPPGARREQRLRLGRGAQAGSGANRASRACWE